jgi:hypothetical protein
MWATVHVPYDAFSGGVELGLAAGVLAVVLGGVVTFIRRATSS